MMTATKVWLIEYEYPSGAWEPLRAQRVYFDEGDAQIKARIFGDEHNHYRAVAYVREVPQP